MFGGLRNGFYGLDTVLVEGVCASLAMELRRLLPDLRRAVGDQRRVLVGFDRGGWSPALFAHIGLVGSQRTVTFA